ncbi:MAG: hypothetical protein RBS43_05570, partial [Candidatus Cloacimonas sp.]|nr:hypothetical protein [Candidatus Cloacimonas sp.]
MAANRFLLIALSLLLFAPSYAQIHFQRKTINLENNVIDYKLATSPIIHHSESVWADSVMLISGIDYQLDYRKAMLRVVGTPQTSNLTIEFLLVPEFLNKPLQTWETQIHSDSLFSTIKRRANPVFISDTKLDIQGVKSFAITFSDDEAFDLKQSLYVNLSGELAKGVSIDAQLSDSQSKLSPEGDSKELSSLDKVFIRVYSKRFELAMGDLEVKFSGTRYTEYFSKFEGLNAWYNNKHYLQAAYSAGSGKYTSIPVVVIDGKQGPYYLKANDYQPGFIIVAGSEEIYVDNSLLERGVDYSIDYAEGSIMFKRLISSTNSVLARFQYSDEYYPQNSYINSSNWKLNDKLSISHHFIWQQDDRDNPLLYEFSAADRDSLRLAGDNAVWGEGVFEVQNGDYKLVEGTTHYEYAPDDSLAIYNLIFSYVGLGQGDYEEYAVGKYRYIGEQQGSWLPQKRLIAPVKRGNLDFALNYGASNLKAGLETIGSVNDRNTFSDVGDEDNFGGIAYGFGELRFAQASLKLEHEQRTANSYLFGKYRDPASEYDFNALASADSLAQQESNVTLGYTAKNLSIS